MKRIECTNLTKKFGQFEAVKSLDFTLSTGESLAFIGPNGAGKSTTMRMIMGFLQPTFGSIKINGLEFSTNPILAQQSMGYLPENAPLYPNRTVTEFLTLAAEIRGIFGKEKRIAIDRAIELCDLEAVRYQLTDTLSKGYQHRTCLAQSIIHDPAILIMDEPTDGLDPNQKREIRSLIKQMAQTKAIIVSTHILEEIEALSNRVLLINRGSKIFDGSPDALKAVLPSGKLDDIFYHLTLGDQTC